MKILIIFTALSLANVIFSTVRSLTTIKSGKTVASFVSAGYYSFYNIVLIWTVADFALWQKCAITFICNLVGVWIVKLIEEKLTKDKMWVFHATINQDFEVVDKVVKAIKDLGIKLVYNEIVKDKLYTMNVYSNTQKESQLLEDIFNTYDVKYCAYKTEIVGK